MGIYDRDYMKASEDKPARRSTPEFWSEELDWEKSQAKKRKFWVIVIILVLVVAFLLPELFFLWSRF